MNTIRLQQIGEPASEWRSPAAMSGGHRWQDAFAAGGNVGVVGDSMLGRGVGVNAGDLPGQEAARLPAEVRAAIVAQASHGKTKAGRVRDHGTKPGNDRWSEGRQEVEPREEVIPSNQCHRLPARARTARPEGLGVANPNLGVSESTSSMWRAWRCVGSDVPTSDSEVRKDRIGQAMTGEPDAGDPPVRFGGRGGANQCVVPTSII